jgi:TPR repeat protein
LKISTAAIIVCLAGSVPAVSFAEPIADAIAAYNKGDFATALSLFRGPAEQGDAAAQTGLGFLYENGEGVPKDTAQALHWFRLAAAQGNRNAQFSLGFMYENGEGVSKDRSEALRWYKLAAAQGFSEASKAVDRLTAGH